MKQNLLTTAFSALTLNVLATLSAAQAEELVIDIELPRLAVAEYHRPYVAVWLEDEKNKATQIAVWYDLDMREHKGQEWLKDMRQWWRRGGRSLELPVDGITSATRGPGRHRLNVAVDKAPLADLPEGDYRLRVEAAREVGGRELLEIPLRLPINADSLPLTAQGERELGRIELYIKSE